MTTNWTPELRRYRRKATLLRVTRRFESHHARGYIIDVGADDVLLSIVNDSIWLDGFECYRIDDITSLVPDPRKDFIEPALTLRGETRPISCPVNLDTMTALLRSANAHFPLVTLHEEETNPGVCWIGRVVDADRHSVSLHQISPDAKWDATPTEHRLSDITRVDFGADYEAALAAVGGAPPIRKQRDRRMG